MGTRNTVDATLLAVLVLSLAVPAGFTGAPGGWAFPPLAGIAVAKAIALTLAVAAAAYTIAWLDARAGAAAMLVCLPLALFFYAVGPQSHIGDWDWVLWATEEDRRLARWYGATWLYASFHRLGAAYGLTALQSVRLLSSIAGALCLYLAYLVARDLGLTRVLRAWPFLYLSAFGVVGIGLAHVEIYSVVALCLGIALWLALRVVQRPRPLEMLALGAAATAAALVYAMGAFALPVFIAVLVRAAWYGFRCRDRRTVAGAIAAIALQALLLAAAVRATPATGPESLSELWTAGSDEARPTPPPFHPRDVFWPRRPELLNPPHWFSAWHLRDFASQVFLDDRAGVALALVLGGGGLWSMARRRQHPFSASTVLLVVLTAPYAAWAFTVVNMRPQPWDWDVWSYAALLTNALAASLVAAAARGKRYGARTNGLLVAVGFASQISGMAFLHACSREPSSMGIGVEGLHLAATPSRLEVDAEGRWLTPLWLWLYNSGDEPVVLQTRWLRFTVAPDGQLRADRPLDSRRREILGSRALPPKGFALLADSGFSVRPGPDGSLPGLAVVGAVLHDPPRPALALVSNPVEIVVRR